jgi:hypothetical protein
MMNLKAFGTGFGNVNNGSSSTVAQAEAHEQQATAPNMQGGVAIDQGALAASAAVAQQSYATALTAVPALRFFLPLPNITSFQSGLDTLKHMEHEGIELSARLVARHNAGRMQADEYAQYEDYRHRFHQTQVAWLTNLRSELMRVAGQRITDQTMAQIPWPGWLPKLEQNGPVVALSGLGLAPIAIAAIVIVVLAAIGVILYFTTEWGRTLQQMYLTKGQTRAIQEMIDARERVFNTCLENGGNVQSCAQVADQTVPTQALLDFLNQLPPSTGLGVFGWIGVAVVGMGLAAVGWWAYKKYYTKPAGTAGVARPKTRKNTRRRGIGAPVRLKSLKASYPSKYMLEV